MLCVRCSHPLPPGADRCLRCFALNPRNSEPARRPEPAEPAEPPPFFEPPFTDPELAAISLSDPPAPPMRISIESDPPPPPLSLSIASDPPEQLQGSIISEPPSGTGPFELAPPASSPNLPRRPRKPAARPPPRQKPAPDPEAPTLVFAAPLEPAEPADLGDVDVASIEESGPLPAQEPPPPGPVELADAWRVVSQPPAVDPLSQSLDLGRGPYSAEPPSSLLATPLKFDLTAEPLPPAKPPRSPWAPVGARILSWVVDAAILALCAALFALLAVYVIGAEKLAPRGFASPDYWLDLVTLGPRLPLLWAGLGACLALAYSWLFAALGGRTPGMALAGLRLVRLGGQPVRPAAALVRALLALLSAAAGLFGFALALFDPRGQTLHDKLTGTAVVRDRAPLAQGPAGF